MTTEPQGAKNTAIEYTQYCRIAIAEMTDWFFGFDMAGVSVNEVDRNDGSPKVGDKIARNPKNHADKWLVAAAYFADNFKPINAEEMTTPEQKEAEKRVIEAAKRRRAFYHKYNYCADCTHESKCKSCFNEDLLTCKLICDAVDALNALSTPVESLPEKVDEWEGWDAWECNQGCCQIAKHRTGQFKRDRPGFVDDWTPWVPSAVNISDPHIVNWSKRHGPARLEVLKTLPDELVKAAKGVGNAK